MKFGIIFSNSGPAAEGDYAAEMARLAESAGIESLWAVEHVVVPAGYESTYPYSADGKMPGGEEFPIPDPLIWLSYVAAATSTIRLGTGILILPQRNPVITAKEAATLDRLSGGRLDLGIGVGWLAEEFDALGIPFDDRAARTDDHVAAMRALWTEEQASYTGSHSSFRNLISLPKPAQESIPIHVGGHSIPSAKRAGRLGDGYFPAKGDNDRLAELFGAMRDAANDAGRNPDDIELTTGARATPDEIKQLGEDLGVDRVVIPPLGFDLGSLRQGLERYADEVIAKVNG
ncbi:MAG TPA: LLM class F420-dependent oxidoreductase [Acidimicrobiales bacterium]